MIRGRHIDLAVLGAFQVSSNGDLASWIVPGQSLKGMGGAMDLVSGVEKVTILYGLCQTQSYEIISFCKIIVTMQHTDKEGRPKIVDACTMPLTGRRVVDMIITELGVFHIDRKNVKGSLTLVEHAPGVSIEDIRSKTSAHFNIAPNLKIFY